MVSYANTPVGSDSDEAIQQKEGPIARAIEKRTARLPSDIFLWAAGASIIASFAAQFAGNRPRRARAPMASFVGMWAPTFLLLGLYNKVVKVAGSDRVSR